MFKPSDEKSQKSQKLISAVLKNILGEDHGYCEVYGYYMKNGLFSKKMYSYAIGFSEEKKEVVVVPIDSNGNAGDKFVLGEDNIQSAKYGLQGEVIIKNSITKQPLRITVPPFTPSVLESTYVLPIRQEEAEKKFRSFIKSTF